MSLNYIDWKNEHQSILETFVNKKVFMLYTGGKDSSVILSFLLLAGREFGFNFETSAATYPNHVFTEAEINKLDAYWRSRGVNIQWHNVNESDVLLSDALQNGKNPCHICQKTKKTYLINYLRKFERENEDVVIILSFTLWDLVSYTIEYLVGGVYSTHNGDGNHNDVSAEQRFLVTSQRFYPLIELKDGLTIFKPLLKYNDNEIEKIASEEKIPLSSAECKYKYFTPKRILSDYYNKVNASFDYDNVLKHMNVSMKLHELSYYRELGKGDFIKLL